MLAPLKDRGILRRAEPGADESAWTLREALRHARQAQKRAAIDGARQVVALKNEINRLSESNRLLQNRLDELENGQAIVALGQQLMAQRQENEMLLANAQRLCFLDRSLCAAQGECERLARARDAALQRFYDFDVFARTSLA